MPRDTNIEGPKEKKEPVKETEKNKKSRKGVTNFLKPKV